MEDAKLEFFEMSFIIKDQRRTFYSFWQEQKVYPASDCFVLLLDMELKYVAQEKM
jgi:hypothetical protein